MSDKIKQLLFFLKLDIAIKRLKRSDSLLFLINGIFYQAGKRRRSQGCDRPV
jgi:hypothetical protein